MFPLEFLHVPPGYVYPHLRNSAVDCPGIALPLYLPFVDIMSRITL